MIFILTIFAGFHVLTEGSNQYRCPNNLIRNAYLKTFRESCYEFINIEVTWSEARDLCTNKMGHLVVIPDQATQNFVYGSLLNLNWNRNGVWIGAHDLNDEMSWYWVTNVPVTWGYWSSSQPSCPWWSPCLEDCANLRLDDGGEWHDYMCSSNIYEYSYICQYAMLPTTITTTTATTTPPTTTTTTAPPTTTTTPPTTTTAPPTTTTTTAPPTTTTTTAPPNTTTAILVSVSSVMNPTTTGVIQTTTSKPTTTKANDVNPNLNAMHQTVFETSLSTGALIGIIFSVILVFIAGLVIGALVCMRRKGKTDDILPAFCNVVYYNTRTPNNTNVTTSTANNNNTEVENHQPSINEDNDINHYTEIGSPNIYDSIKGQLLYEAKYDNLHDILDSDDIKDGACAVPFVALEFKSEKHDMDINQEDRPDQEDACEIPNNLRQLSTFIQTELQKVPVSGFSNNLYDTEA